MPETCCVTKCRSGYSGGGKVSMFAFPAYSDKREKWKRAIHRIDGGQFSFDSPHTRVCEKHFDHSDAVWHDELVIDGDEVLHKRGKSKLREDAVPRIFDGCLRI
ncbi:uncharacterized protein LOC135384335 [Ornithodoros turicata]|uniref:uncharacterized protein LOC135384335 n=1 Tax=Ornithodoros turicata TaxID=34597 RepID=UPI0031388587